MLRIIIFIIAIYIAAKIIGVALRFIRFFSDVNQPRRTPPPSSPRPGTKMPYGNNVEDADFEDITDKK
ncbi:MAG TPA: hypothetical protein VK470_09755 [Bacteroidota bacterium]|nr:hypothetical protein [Bacteroidota bacterium]